MRASLAPVLRQFRAVCSGFERHSPSGPFLSHERPNPRTVESQLPAGQLGFGASSSMPAARLRSRVALLTFPYAFPKRDHYTKLQRLIKKKPAVSGEFVSGAYEIRTRDLRLAKSV